MQETWRSDSPERYTYHSNFRRGTASQRNSPTRHSSVSPDRYRLAEPAVGTQRRMSISKTQARSQSTSHGSSRLPSHGPSRQTSGRSSPTRRRGSIISRTSSPSRAAPSHRRIDSLHLLNGKYDMPKKEGSRESRSPSQSSNRHSLDSEKLYRNLESISRRGSSAIHTNSYEGFKASPRIRTAVNSSVNTRSCNSRELSPSRNSYSSPQQDPRDNRLSASLSSSRGSSHSEHSRPLSGGSSASRCAADPQVLGSLSCVAVTETDKGLAGSNAASGVRSKSNVRRGMEALLISEPKKATVETEEVRVYGVIFSYEAELLSFMNSFCYLVCLLVKRDTVKNSVSFRFRILCFITSRFSFPPVHCMGSLENTGIVRQ